MRRFFGLLLLVILLSLGALFALYRDRFDPLEWARRRLTGRPEQPRPRLPSRVVRATEEVPHRTNPRVPAWADDPERQRQLSQVFAIGGKAGLEEFFFLRPSDVDIDAAGRVYVVDRGHRRVQVFAADGSFLRSLRYDSKNLPYFLSPSKLTVSEAGEIYVWDETKGIVSFDRNGRFLRQIRLPYEISDLVVDSRGHLFVLAPSEPVMIHKLSAKGAELLAFGEHSQEDTALWAAFDLGHLAVGPGDTLYYSTIFPYRIMVFSPDGRTIRSFERELGILITPPTISRDAAGRVRSVTRQEISFGLAVGGDSLVYNLVRTRASPGGDRIDVFSSAGEFLQVFYLPVPAVRLAMRGSRLVLLQAPPDQRVICYDVTSLTLESRPLLGELDRSLR